MALLEVTGLSVSFGTTDGVVRAVRDLSFSLESGRTLGIVGESGSGKSVSMQTIVGLTRTRGSAVQVSGRALFEGSDLLTMPPAGLREVRGSRIGMVFQDPLSSLHPFYKVGWQIVELLRRHQRSMSRRDARARAVELLGLVGIPEPARRIDEYPHQFSGGMRQRVMIAMAMALNPSLLIADEPTTALDVTVQAQILSVLERLQAEFGTAIVLITHDLGVIAEVADDVVVMYAGSVMEQAERRELFYDHRHPYTVGLLRSVPTFEGGERKLLHSIPGQPPSLILLGPGCPFAPRCEVVRPECPVERPPLGPVSGSPTHQVACFLDEAHDPAPAVLSSAPPTGPDAPAVPVATTGAEP